MSRHWWKRVKGKVEKVEKEEVRQLHLTRCQGQRFSCATADAGSRWVVGGII